MRLPLIGLLALGAGGCDSPVQPQPQPSPTSSLPTPPTLVSPVGGVQVDSDNPVFVVQNAGPDFGPGQANYTFRITSRTGAREILAFGVPAGNGTTTATAPQPLARGMELRWQVTASNATAEQTSATATFRLPPVNCVATDDPYAKSWVDWFVPACSLAQNIYNDPDDVPGPPNAGGRGPDRFFGFLSLGDGGHIDVDMGTCAKDGAAFDVRVWQAVSSEPVAVYAAGRPEGPYVRIRQIRNCGKMSPDFFSGYCDFDLAEAEIDEARYLRIEDGERTPCNQAGTVSEGADIDAVELLNQRP